MIINNNNNNNNNKYNYRLGLALEQQQVHQRRAGPAQQAERQLRTAWVCNDDNNN